MNPNPQEISRREFVRDTAAKAVGLSVGILDRRRRVEHRAGRCQRGACGGQEHPQLQSRTWNTAASARPACGSRPCAWADTGSGSTKSSTPRATSIPTPGPTDQADMTRLSQEPPRSRQPLHRGGDQPHRLRRRRGAGDLLQGARRAARQDVPRLFAPGQRIARSGQPQRARSWSSCSKPGLKRCKLEYADVWRLMALERGGMHSQAEAEAMVEALQIAQRKGLCRFTGFSTHDRKWAKMLIEKYPDVMQVLCTPYTAKSKVLPEDSLFDAIKKHDVGPAGHQAVCQQRDLPGRRLARQPPRARTTTARPAWRSATSSAIRRSRRPSRG